MSKGLETRSHADLLADRQWWAVRLPPGSRGASANVTCCSCLTAAAEVAAMEAAAAGAIGGPIDKTAMAPVALMKAGAAADPEAATGAAGTAWLRLECHPALAPWRRDRRGAGAVAAVIVAHFPAS